MVKSSRCDDEVQGVIINPSRCDDEVPGYDDEVLRCDDEVLRCDDEALTTDEAETAEIKKCWWSFSKRQDLVLEDDENSPHNMQGHPELIV